MRKPAAAAAALLAALVITVPGTGYAAPATLQTATPAAGSTVSGNIVWEVTASGAAVKRIDFSIDGAQRWTEYLSPYRFNGDAGNLDTRTLSDGSHTLTARATTTTGETSTTSVTVNVQNNTGSSFGVSTVTPVAGSTVTGAVTWEAKMTAGTASQIDFLIDGTQRWTERLAPYRFNGDTGTLDTTTLANGTHTLTVRAKDALGHTATSDTSVTVSNGTSSPPPPPPSGSLNRTVYCFGSPTYGTGGWAYDGTSLGWIRQYPSGLPQRVGYDNSVSLMTGLGCNTIKAEIQPNDPDPNGGTDVQRAQLYSTDSLLAKYGSQPSLGITRGTFRWYAFAFSSNSGYRPQASANWPNYNYVFSFHNGGPSGPPNVVLAVATANQSGCGQPYTPLSQPRLVVELNGGDPAKFPYSGATCLRFFGPTFSAGARYVVEMGIRWADNGTGSFEVWINGQQVANVANVSTMWTGQSIFPVFENYRPGKSMIGNLVTWTNTLYYAGLVAGPTRADVALPNS